MSEHGTLVGGGDGFGGCNVYLRADDAGPVFTIEFRNREARPGRTRMVITYLALWVPALTFVAMFVGGMVSDDPVYFEYIAYPAIAMMASFALLIVWALFPIYSKRLIVMDFGRDTFVVKRNGRTVVSERGPLNVKITVDDHPETAVEREQRARNRQSGPGKKEKQHTLVGWFGIGGAIRRDLVHRYEWPKTYSLQVVGACVIWVRDFVRQNAGDPQAIAGTAPPESGIAPPLD